MTKNDKVAVPMHINILYQCHLTFKVSEVKRMNQRYMKVLGLYVLSTAIATVVTRICHHEHFLKWFTQTTIGYGVFAYGLKAMKRAKTKG